MRKVFVEPVVLPDARFRDGLGIRYVRNAGGDDAAEVLRPLDDIAANRPQIQQRVARLTSFRQARFLPVRGVEVPRDEGGAVEVISDFAPGHRLSEVLDAAAAGSVTVASSAAIHVVREVLGALAVFHESRSMTHGAIGPERLILSPKGRILVADYVLGAALARLEYGRARLWREFRIATPPGKGTPALDDAADVAQVGVTAAALLAGRPLESDEFPVGLADLIAALGRGRSDGRSQALPAPLLGWLKRATGLDHANRFRTAADARSGLEAALTRQSVASGGAAALKALAEEYGRIAAVADAAAAAREAAEAASRARDIPAEGQPRTPVENEDRSGRLHAPRTVLVPAFTLLPDAPGDEHGEDMAGTYFLEKPADDAQGDQAVGWRLPEPVAPDEPLVASRLIGADASPRLPRDAEFPEEVINLDDLAEDGYVGPAPGEEEAVLAAMEAVDAGETAIGAAADAGAAPSPLESDPEIAALFLDDADRRVVRDLMPVDTMPSLKPLPLPEVDLAAVEAQPDVAALFEAGPEPAAAEALAAEPELPQPEIEPIVVEPELTEPIAAVEVEPEFAEAIAAVEAEPQFTEPIAAVEAEPEFAEAIAAVEAESEFSEPIAAVEVEPEFAEAIAAVEVAPEFTEAIAAVEVEPEFAEAIAAVEAEPEPAFTEAIAAVETEPEFAEAIAAVEAEPEFAEPIAAVEVEPDVAEAIAAVEAEPEFAKAIAAVESEPEFAEAIAAVEAEPEFAEAIAAVEAEPEFAKAIAAVEAELVPAEIVTFDEPAAIEALAAEPELPQPEIESVVVEPEPPEFELTAADVEAAPDLEPALEAALAAIGAVPEEPVLPGLEFEFDVVDREPTCAEAHLAIEAEPRGAPGPVFVEAATERPLVPMSDAASADHDERGAGRADAEAFQSESSILIVPGRDGTESTAVPGFESGPGEVRPAGEPPDAPALPRLPTDWLIEVDLGARPHRHRRTAERPPLGASIELPEHEQSFGEGSPSAAAQPPLSRRRRVEVPGFPEPGPAVPHAEETAVAAPPEPSEALPSPAVAAQRAATPDDVGAAPARLEAGVDADQSSGTEEEETGPVFPRVAPSVRRVRAQAGRRRAARIRASAKRAAGAVARAGAAASVGVLAAATSTARNLAAAAAGTWRAAGHASSAAAGHAAAASSAVVKGIGRGVSATAAGVASGFRGTARALTSLGAATGRGATRAARGAGSALVWLGGGLASAAASCVKAVAGLFGAMGRAGAAAARAAASGATGAVRVLSRGLAGAARGCAKGIGGASFAAGRGIAGAGKAAASAATGLAHVAGRAAAWLRVRPRRVLFFLSDAADRLPRPKIRLGYLAVALALIAGATGFPYVKARLFAPAPASGTVRVESQRAGLAVRIDGVEMGEAPVSAELPVGKHRVEVTGGGRTRVQDVDVTVGRSVVVQAGSTDLRATGSLRIQTEPPGADVWVDGVARGAAPVALEAVAEGPHTIVVRNADGTVRQSVQVRADETADAAISIRPGWLAVFSPVRLDILEGGKPIGSTEGGRLLARPGDHVIELVSPSFGYRETRRVEVRPGQVSALTVQLPPVEIEVVAPPGSEIWVDGVPAGTAPTGPVKAPVGTREIRMRHPDAGDRRQVVTVTYGRPVRVVFD